MESSVSSPLLSSSVKSTPSLQRNLGAADVLISDPRIPSDVIFSYDESNGYYYHIKPEFSRCEYYLYYKLPTSAEQQGTFSYSLTENSKHTLEKINLNYYPPLPGQRYGTLRDANEDLDIDMDSVVGFDLNNISIGRAPLIRTEEVPVVRKYCRINFACNIKKISALFLALLAGGAVVLSLRLSTNILPKYFYYVSSGVLALTFSSLLVSLVYLWCNRHRQRI